MSELAGEEREFSELLLALAGSLPIYPTSEAYSAPTELGGGSRSDLAGPRGVGSAWTEADEHSSASPPSRETWAKVVPAAEPGLGTAAGASGARAPQKATSSVTAAPQDLEAAAGAPHASASAETAAARSAGAQCSWLEGGEQAVRAAKVAAAQPCLWHVLGLAWHFTVTVVTSIGLPLLAPVAVHLLQGGRWGMIVIFSANVALLLLVFWRVFWICSGRWSRGWVPVVVFVATTLARVVSLGLPQLRSLITDLANLSPIFYLLCILWFGRSYMPFRASMWLIAGVVISSIPVYLSAILSAWLSARYTEQVITDPWRNSSIQWNVGIAGVVWTLAGVIVQRLGNPIWRRATVQNRKTLKIFEFGVHIEVAFTASGLQLFTGSALVQYVFWAVLTKGAYSLRMLPFARKWFPAGSTDALHVVRIFVQLIATAYGIACGLALLLFGSFWQWILHPGCLTVDEQNLGPSLRSPTLSPARLPEWFACVLLVCLALCLASWASVRLLSRTSMDLHLSSFQPGTSQAASAVDQMAHDRPWAFLIGFARLCLRRSNSEVRFILALHILQMCAVWFVTNHMKNDTFWFDWHEEHSWFHCE